MTIPWKRLQRILLWTCGAALAFVFLRLALYHLAEIIYPFPAEYREGVMLGTTQCLLRGINPFGLMQQPAYTNDYGIFFSLVCWPFVKFFNHPLLVHRAIAGLFIALNGVWLVAVMRRLAVPTLLIGWAVLVYYLGMLFQGSPTSCANPSPLGMFLFYTALLWPWLRNFSGPSLVVSAVAGVLAYYTKPYFFASVPLLGLYLLLFVNKGKAFLYGLGVILLTAITAVIMNHACDTYFSDCFFIHTNVGHMSFAHMFRQVDALKHLFWPIWVFGTVALLVYWWQSVRSWSWPRLSLIRPSTPFWSPAPAYIGYLALSNFLLLGVWLGKHEQAWLWYYFHLWIPFAMVAIADLVKQKKFWWLALALTGAVNLLLLTPDYRYQIFNAQDKTWIQVRDIIKSRPHVLTTSPLSPLLVEAGQDIYDSGLSEYFKMGGYRDNELVKVFSKGDPRIILRYYSFMREMREKLASHYFDVALLTYNYTPMIPGELQIYYRCIGEIKVVPPQTNDQVTLTVWVPQ